MGESTQRKFNEQLADLELKSCIDNIINPKVSVIIPIYNVEKYLRQCLDSVISQSLKEIEIICINDGSPDKSIQILLEYAQQDNRIIIIDRENRGVAESRNEGIKKASGEFVCFIDPDDYYPTNDILEALYNGVKKKDVLICGGEFSNFSVLEPELKQNYNRKSGYLFDKDSIINYKDYQFDYGYHRFIYNREFLIENNILFPNYTRFEDPPFLVNAMISAGKFYALDKITYAYRTGHKDVHWSKQNINDLLDGLALNISYAQKYNLKKLKNFTKIRFKQHYKDNHQILNSSTLNKCINIIGFNILYIFLQKYIENIFSIKNSTNKTHKVIALFGTNIKIRREKIDT